MAKLSERSSKSTETAGERYAKTDPKYWLPKVFKPVAVKGGERIESQTYSVRVMFEGRRKSFPLGLGSKRDAAKEAAKIYKSLLGKGWPATIEEFGKASNVSGEATIGDLFEAVGAVSSTRRRTLQDYENALRTIAADLKKLKRDKSRFDYVNGGSQKWRERIDRIRLAELTPARIDKWRRDFVKSRSGDPEAERRAKNSANSLLRQARSLFGAKLVKKAADGGQVIEYVNAEGDEKRLRLPDPLPFEGIEFYQRGDSRYFSKIDAPALLADAIAELGTPAPLSEKEKDGLSKTDIAKHERSELLKPEALKILLFALLAGLRRNEIDKLIWDQIDFDRGTVEIRATRYFKPKTTKSAGEVELDAELVALLRGFKARTKGEFVIESGNAAALDTTTARYRADRAFGYLQSWLRKKGVESRTPIHTLRKEFGSLICQKVGLYAASRALRHAGIAITAEHYLDKKERVTVGLGSVLAENVVELKPDSDTAHTSLNLQDSTV